MQISQQYDFQEKIMSETYNFLWQVNAIYIIPPPSTLIYMKSSASISILIAVYAISRPEIGKEILKNATKNLNIKENYNSRITFSCFNCVLQKGHPRVVFLKQNIIKLY